MPTIRKKFLNRKRILTEPQEEHLIEGYSLDSHFPFENEAQRKTFYLDNKQYLIERTKDPRRKEDHFFYKEGREFPQAFFDYEIKKSNHGSNPVLS